MIVVSKVIGMTFVITRMSESTLRGPLTVTHYPLQPLPCTAACSYATLEPIKLMKQMHHKKGRWEMKRPFLSCYHRSKKKTKVFNQKVATRSLVKISTRGFALGPCLKCHLRLYDS